MPTNLPTPTTSVAPGGAPLFQSSLPAIPQPPANLALPNPTPNIIQAQTPGSTAQGPATLTAAQFAQQYGTPGPAATGPTGPATLTADQFAQQYGTGASGPTGGGGVSSGLASFAKDIFSAPATLIARPIQAAAEVFGATAGQVDTATSNIENAVAGGLKKIPLIGNALGDTAQGLVAPVDQNLGDVEKDVGRGAQTVALGVADAPIATGALFGAGTSLEQGNKLLSAQTALDTALGAGGGKVLDWLGKPLLNAAGKVIGTITPQVIQDVAAGGAKAVAQFAAEHDLPLGLQKIATPAADAIQGAASAVDNGINKGVAGAANGAGRAIAAQYPNVDPVGHFKEVNQQDLVRPAMSNESRFANATDIYENAKSQGIDIGDEMTKMGIQHDDISKGGVYNTKNLAKNLEQNEYDIGNKIIRPAIREIQAGIPNTSVSDVRTSLLNKIKAVPGSSLNDTDREWMENQINRQYGNNSAAARANPDGYNLETLHDNRIVEQGNAKYKNDGTPLENRPAKLARYKGQVFSNLFDSKAPSEFQDVRAEQEKNFKVANYLRALNGKKVPEGITQKAIRLFGRGLGSVLGSHVGGYPGLFVGGRIGDALFDRFDTIPNPFKGAALRSAFANKAEPEVFQALQKRVGAAEAERLMRLPLPAAGETSGAPIGAPKPSPTLFSTPGGQAAPDLQNAVDMSSSRVSKVPATNTKSPAYKAKVLAAQLNQGPYVPPRSLPVIDMGKPASSPRSLNDIRF